MITRVELENNGIIKSMKVTKPMMQVNLAFNSKNDETLLDHIHSPQVHIFDIVHSMWVTWMGPTITIYLFPNS